MRECVLQRIHGLSRLRRSGDLASFAQGHARALGRMNCGNEFAPMPTASLEDAAVWGITRGDRVLGGFVFRRRAPFRVLDAVPSDRWSDVSWPQSIPLDACSEITALWRGADVGTLDTIRLWLGTWWVAWSAGTQYCIVSATNAPLERLYESMEGVRIYRGPLDGYPRDTLALFVVDSRAGLRFVLRRSVRELLRWRPRWALRRRPTVRAA